MQARVRGQVQSVSVYGCEDDGWTVGCSVNKLVPKPARLSAANPTIAPETTDQALLNWPMAVASLARGKKEWQRQVCPTWKS